MELVDINKKIDEIYADKRAKNFFNHLVRAYIPAKRVTGVLEKPETIELRCVLTKELSLSVGEILGAIKLEEAKKEFNDNIKTMFDEKSDVESPLLELIGDKHLAVTGTDTRTCMTFPAYQAFNKWVVAKMLSGDKHINWLLKNVRKDSMFHNVKKSDNKGQKKPYNNRQASKPSTFTLGDLGVLQELKKKMKD